MAKKIAHNLRVGYGFSVIILIIVGIFCYRTIDQLFASNRDVEQSELVLKKLESALSVMKDAETGQRGFLLTGQDQFLEPYTGSPQRAIDLVVEVQQLKRQQQQDLEQLRQLLTARMKILEEQIEKRKRGERITNEELNAGKAAMDALRRSVAHAENVEQHVLDERTATQNSYASLTPWLIGIAILLAVFIAVRSYIQVIRDLHQKEKLRAELFAKEQETSAYNEELTAANEEITAANEELTAINEELAEAQNELARTNDSLEQKVAERTSKLAASEIETQALNEELSASNEELAATNEELLATNEELAESQRKLGDSLDQLRSAKSNVDRREKLFRTIAQNIPGSLVIVMDRDQRLLTIEGDASLRMGYQQQDYVGKKISEVMPAERYSATRELYERMLGGEQFRTERKGSDGADYQVDFVPLYEDNHDVYAGLIIAIDITDIKKAEERSAKLAAIVESSDDAIISKGLDGIITSWNRGAERLFGHHEADMIGQSILKLIPEDRQDEEPAIIARLSQGERIEHFETRRRTRDGQLIDVSLTISPIKDASGKVTGISKIARDITSQKLEEQRKSDFIAIASHELKTPLTSLSALVQVLNQKLRNSEDSFVPNAIGKVQLQVGKMITMLNSFLNVSRLEAGKLQLDKQTFDMTELIRSVIDETMLTSGGHTLSFECADPVMIEADRDKITSVVSNLISNAIKYSPKGKLIEVACMLDESKVTVSVKDEGMGIKPQDVPRLFDRYYRVSSQHTKHISGFGIGLYLSAEIIQRHDGRIWAESESGVGSTFYFTLPR